MYQFNETIRLLEHTTNYYVMCIDMAGRYSYINGNYAKRFRHVNDNFVGKEFSITMHPDDIDGCRIAGMKAIADNRSFVPVTIRKHDGAGGYVITQWEFKSITDEHDLPTGVFCLGHDITEFINELDGKDMLLNDIAFSQSHVVRLPVANILGAAALLGDMELPAAAKELLHLLTSSAEELDVIIRKISDDING